MMMKMTSRSTRMCYLLIFALMGLVVLSGCSDEAKITDKTEWLCEYDQHETPDPEIVPDGVSLEDYVDSEVIAYVEDEADEGEFGEFEAGLAEAFEPLVQGSMAAMAPHTECVIDDVDIDGEWARVEFSRQVPEFDLGLEALGEFDEDADADDVEETMREWIAESDTTTTTEHTLLFRDTDDGWRAHHDLERRELQEELDDVEERLHEVRGDIEDEQEARQNLADFSVHSAGLRQVSQGRYRSDKTVIDLEVENETEHAISTVYFDAEYTSPDRQVPWNEGSFNYSISGGVEPGETAEWSLEPNMMNDWYDTPTRDGAELQVEVVGLDGPDGDTLWELPSDNDYDFDSFGDSPGGDFDSLQEERDHLEERADELRQSIDDHTPDVLG